MTTTIAISGKGGSGKTTLSAVITRLLCGRGRRGVLAVDGDPNSCLGITLGAESAVSISQLREKAAKKGAGSGSDRVRTFEYDIQAAITEADGFDLLTMGHPEGPGCYCAANNLLRKFLDEVSLSYDFVVNDNEAGMEHLSRRTTTKVDCLCIVAEPTAIGVMTAKRIFKLAKELPITVKKVGIIWNKAETSKEVEGIEVFGCVPYDESLVDASMRGATIFDVNEDSCAIAAVRKILEEKVIN